MEEKQVPYEDRIILVYKKVNIKNGVCTPLYFETDREFEIGTWMSSHYVIVKDRKQRSINGFGEDAIGGWHSCPSPEASWIADELKSGKTRAWIVCAARNVVQYTRPQGIWFLSGEIMPLAVLTRKQVEEINNGKHITEIIPITEICRRYGVEGIDYNPKILE